jgi:hypothetical protein
VQPGKWLTGLLPKISPVTPGYILGLTAGYCENPQTGRNIAGQQNKEILNVKVGG